MNPTKKCINAPALTADESHVPPKEPKLRTLPLTSRSLSQRTGASFLALALVAGLAGCGGGSSSRSGDSDQGQPPAPVNQAPIARMTASPISGDVPLAVAFDATASSDADGTISSYSWDFGDGATGSGQTTTHSYTSVGSFIAVLTVIDNDGANDTTSQTVSTTQPPAEAATLSGQIQILASSAIDSDVNDVLSVANVSNNTAANAQPIPLPVSLGGFANVALTGPASGRLFTSGDTSDFYSIAAAGGEQVTLDVGGHPGADLDLRLWDASNTLIDASVGFNASESVVLPAAGDYFIEVVAAANASNYVLSVGQPLAGNAARAATRLTDSFVPGEMLLVETKNKAGANATSTAAYKSITATAVKARAGDVLLHQMIDTKAEAASTARAIVAHSSSRVGTLSNSEAVQINALPAATVSDELALRYATLRQIGDLRRDNQIAAEPNLLRKAHAVPNDPLFGAQWHYDAINLPAAWDLTEGNQDVVIAVLDTGVLIDHPDFSGQLVAGYDFISDANRASDGDGIDDNPNDPGDAAIAGNSSFHGTHVAGTAGATTDNDTGVAGAGWNTRIMPLRVLGRDGGTSFDILQAARFAAGLTNASGTTPAARADIINLSLGGGTFSQTEQDLFLEIRAQGVLVFASAGNESTAAPGYPAAYEGVVSVSATTIDNTLANYSNFGPDIDLAAPGGNSGTDLNGDGVGDGVMSAIGDDSNGQVSFGFGLLSGTSMAAPHAAGVAALMKAIHPALTPDEFDLALFNGDLTQDLGPAGRDDQYGFGLIDAQKAVFTATALASGTSADPGPILRGSIKRRNLGTFQSELSITLSNAGTQTLTIESIESDQPWLSATPAQVDANGVGTYTVRADRSGLDNGTYRGRLTFNSNSNPHTLEVVLQVSAIDLAANAGTHFAILVNDINVTISQTFVNTPTDGMYSFSFTDVPPGSYRLFAGTDLDNDDLLCDAGEACGAYRTLDAPEVVIVEGDRSDLDFLSGFRQNFGASSNAVSVEGISSQNSGYTINKEKIQQR